MIFKENDFPSWPQSRKRGYTMGKQLTGDSEVTRFLFFFSLFLISSCFNTLASFFFLTTDCLVINGFWLLHLLERNWLFWSPIKKSQFGSAVLLCSGNKVQPHPDLGDKGAVVGKKIMLYPGWVSSVLIVLA